MRTNKINETINGIFLSWLILCKVGPMLIGFRHEGVVAPP